MTAFGIVQSNTVEGEPAERLAEDEQAVGSWMKRGPEGAAGEERAQGQGGATARPLWAPEHSLVEVI